MNQALKSAISHYQQKKGEIYIGGKGITTIAREYGTPLYIYNRSIIERRANELRATMPSDLRINYAVKANPHADILSLMADLYDGFDIASKGEMARTIRTGKNTMDINFAGPGKSLGELKFVLKNDIGSISVESEREVEHIAAICKDLNLTARILIRVNPDFELISSGMKTGGGATKFGIDFESVPALIEKIQKENYLEVIGIHIFAGSQNIHAEKILDVFEKILEYAEALSDNIKFPLKQINLGGGFGIPYFSHEKDLDIDIVGNGLKKLFCRYRPIFPNTQFKIELGRYLVGESGIYLCRVLYRKISRHKIFLITDGGMHHHLAASGNFGQSLVRRPMPLATANRLNNPLEKVTVAGPLCTPLDTFGTVEMPRADEGDLVAVLNSGAYGFSASPLNFLSRKAPVEVVI